MTNDAERVSDIVARLRDVRDRAQQTINTGGRDDFDPRDVPFVADDALTIIEAQSKALAEAREDTDLQQRVAPWMQACFGPEISGDKLERGDRALEEMLEMLQSGDYPAERVAMLTAYVYGRPKGEPHQEVGGVMITLAAYCLAHGLDMHKAGEDELARIWTKVEKIREKQRAKPRGSALPVALAPTPENPNG